MKRLLIGVFCVLIYTYIQSNEESVASVPQPNFRIKNMIEPPMSLSQDLPVTISQNNRQRYLDNLWLKEQEERENEAYIKNREFPWFPILSAIVVVMGCIWIRIRMYS